MCSLIASPVITNTTNTPFPVSNRSFLYTHPETYQQLFLVLFDAFSSRFFKTNVIFLYTLFLLHPCFL